MSQQETIPVKNLAFGLAIAFGVLAIFIFIVLTFTRLGLDEHHDDEAHPQSHEVSQQERIKPVGQVRLEGQPEPTIPVAAEKTPTPAVETASAPKSGKEIFESVCFACHKDGLLGSPKLGDKAEWTKRFEKGEAALVQNSIKGIFQMPPRGGNAALSDEDMKKAVQYMLAEAGLSQETDTPKTEEKTTTEPGMLDAAGANITSSQSEIIETTTPAEETTGTEPETSADTPTEETASTAEKTTESTTASTDPVLAKGEEIYNSACALCHGPGIAKITKAPEFGNKDNWAPRIAKGMETLFSHALNGFQGEGIMPPKGGFTHLADEDIKAAVTYMVSKAQ